MNILKGIFKKVKNTDEVFNGAIDDYINGVPDILTAPELKQKYTPEYLEAKRIKYEKDNAESVECDIMGRVKCNMRHITYLCEQGKTKYEVDSRRNCCLDDRARQRFREMGYSVTEQDYKYMHEGRELTYTIYTISW